MEGKDSVSLLSSIEISHRFGRAILFVLSLSHFSMNKSQQIWRYRVTMPKLIAWTPSDGVELSGRNIRTPSEGVRVIEGNTWTSRADVG